MEDQPIVTEDNIARAHDLLATLERGDEAGAKEIIDELTSIRESDLYMEMGKLTRELHDAISAFGMDEQISTLAEQDIPDARQRLHHVMDMTDQAAHRTLNAVEESIPVCDEMRTRSAGIADEWKRFKKRDMKLEEFRKLAAQLDEFFELNTSDAGKLRESLNSVLMAQDFQDLTSQIIKKVIKLVEDVEAGLIGIIKLTNPKGEGSAVEKKVSKLDGPVVPGVNDSGTVSGQDEVDDLLSSLGF